VSKNCLVLGPVIFVNAAYIGKQRDSPDKEQKQGESDHSIHQVKDNIVAQRRPALVQFRGGQQGDEFVHEDEEGNRHQHIDGDQPAPQLRWFFILLLPRRLFQGRHCPFRRRASRFLFFLLLRHPCQQHVGGKLECPESQAHGLSQRH